MPELFGRTNAVFPPVWLRLLAPHPQAPGWHEGLMAAAAETGAPLDLTAGTSLWGPLVKGLANPILIFGGGDLANTRDRVQAGERIQGEIIARLSSLGTGRIDFFFLRSPVALEEYQLDGALEALASAREDGLIRYLGIAVDGPPLATLGNWQFHDAFEAIAIPRNPLVVQPYALLAPMAAQRRVGVLLTDPLDWGRGAPFTALPGAEDLGPAAVALLSADHPVLVEVRTPEDVRALARPEPRDVDWPIWIARYQDPAAWEALARDPRPWVRGAAR